MSKLTVMWHSQIVMGILNINPYTFASPALGWIRLLCPFLITIIMFVCLFLIASFAYQETHLQLALEAVVVFLGGTASICSYLNMKWKKERIGELNRKLQEIVDEGAYNIRDIPAPNASISMHHLFSAFEEPSLAPIYWSVERKCQRLSEQMFAFMFFEQLTFVLALLYSIYCVCCGNLDTSTYYLPLKMTPPFNVDSLIGWYPFWVLEFVCSMSYMFGSVVVTVYFVCCCFYLDAFCDHFNTHLESIDAEFRKNPNSINARKTLINAINHHHDIYE